MHRPADKSQLREHYLVKRQAISDADRAAWTMAACEKIYTTIHPIAPPSAVIAGYKPVKGEIDPMPALTKLLAHNHRMALPVMGKEEGRKQLSFHPWKPGDTLTVKQYGIHEPELGAEILLPDIVIVPLVAYDLNGNRLGYGGGYYDAVLRKLRAVKPDFIAIGVGFSLQEDTMLPSEAYDEKLHKIITEKEVITLV
jgi:5-formyltetrahydrofolate cyclo-ligase